MKILFIPVVRFQSQRFNISCSRIFDVFFLFRKYLIAVFHFHHTASVFEYKTPAQRIGVRL